METQQQLDDLLMAAVQKGASDIHLSPGYYPTIRVDNVLVPLSDYKILTKQEVESIAFTLLGKERKEVFLEKKESDFSYQLGQNMRFRVNVYETKGNLATVLRYISNEIRTIDELHLPEQLKLFSKLSQGFVLV